MRRTTDLTKPYKLTRRISVKLATGVGLSLIALITLVAYLGIQTQEKNSINRMLQGSNWFSDTLKRATRYAMLKDQRDNVHAIVETVGQQEGVDAIRIFNKKGQIMFSNRKEEIGLLADMQADACYACHFKNEPLTRLPLPNRSRIYYTPYHGPDKASHRVLGVINPIYAEPACYTDPCHAHSPDQTVLGVLDITLSLAGVDMEGKQIAQQLSVAAVGVVTMITTILIVFINYFVNRPLSILVNATKQISLGDYEHQIKPVTDDEIGMLAESFNAMRLSIKNKTAQLNLSRQQYQSLFEQVPCHITVQDRNLRLVAFNKNFEHTFGGQLGDYCYQAYKGFASKCPNCPVEKSFLDGKSHSTEERVLNKNNQPLSILTISAPLHNEHGNIETVIELATDITALRLLEDELRKSEEKYRRFFDDDPIPVLVLEQQTLNILDINDRAAVEYRYAKAELIGQPFLTLTSPTEQARVKKFLHDHGSVLPRVLQRRADGQLFFVNMRASYSEHIEHKTAIVTTADISAIIEAEQGLVQAAKMATLGEMSAGVAHELNQPLSVIATASNFLAKQANRGVSLDLNLLREITGEVLSQVERAKRIITHLREFGRKAQIDCTKVNLSEPIKGMLHLLSQQLHLHNICLSYEAPDDLPPILGDANRLEQVFINLVLNARDAIDKRRSDKGTLKGLIAIRAWVDGDLVRISVSDNGSGILPQHQERIFEPFFTTKEVGKGTGLGLSISYSIVHDYGGVIDVSSQPGHGTTVQIGFPVAKEETA